MEFGFDDDNDDESRLADSQGNFLVSSEMGSEVGVPQLPMPLKQQDKK